MHPAARVGSLVALVACVAAGGCATSVDDTSGVGGTVRTDSGRAGDQGLAPDAPVTTDSGAPTTDGSRGGDSTSAVDTGSADSSVAVDSGPPDTGTFDAGPPDTGTFVDTAPTFDTDTDTGTPPADTAAPGCTMDSDCAPPFNCCDVSSGKCGVIVFFVCAPF